jgi:hypothetical protein
MKVITCYRWSDISRYINCGLYSANPVSGYSAGLHLRCLRCLIMPEYELYKGGVSNVAYLDLLLISVGGTDTLILP